MCYGSGKKHAMIERVKMYLCRLRLELIGYVGEMCAVCGIRGVHPVLAKGSSIFQQCSTPLDTPSYIVIIFIIIFKALNRKEKKNILITIMHC